MLKIISLRQNLFLTLTRLHISQQDSLTRQQPLLIVQNTNLRTQKSR